MNADGSDLTKVSKKSYKYADPSWSPDGTRIIFARSRDADSLIYEMRADGTREIGITKSPGSNYSPVWLPARQPER